MTRRFLRSLAVLLLALVSSPAVRARVDSARVVAVHDGDTITVRVGDRSEKVRLVGIDAPELNDERADYQQVAVEARDAARTLLKGKTVTLETDPRQGDRDKYQRLLRYVILGDGTNANEWLVRHGFARVYNRFEFVEKGRFKEDEAEAKREKLGIWVLPPGPARVTPKE
jgi:micrococcal nuclease